MTLFSFARKRLVLATAHVPHLWRACLLVWNTARKWTIVWLLLLAAEGLLPVAVVYLTRSVVDGLVAAMKTHGARPELFALAPPVILLGAVLLATESLEGITRWVRTVLSELLHDRIDALIHDKSSEVDLAFYDFPEYYDGLHRARKEAAYRPYSLVEHGGVLIRNAITLGAMLGVLIPFGRWLPVALLASSVPAVMVVLRYAALQHEFRHRNTPRERRADYYDWLLTDRGAAAELRLFQLAPRFSDAFGRLRETLRTEVTDLARRQAWSEFTAGGIGLLLSTGCTAWMGLRAIQGQTSLGNLALFYQAFQQGLRLMHSLLESVGHLYLNSLFLGNLFEFLELGKAIKDPEDPVPFPATLASGIRFRNVSFAYPRTSEAVLQDFDLNIPAGRVTAILGPNGAGKSTLIKLICRFYDVNEGTIEIDGRDIREFSIEDMRRHISVLFQEPVHYNATLAENISMAVPDGNPTQGEVESAAGSAGVQRIANKLASQYATPLGSRFEDAGDLSVGEWQCVALARAYLRKAPIVILDEPTSAMDPWAEAEWLSRFRRLVEGRTALVITHRFSTAMAADRIYVMGGGRIAEQGTHEELMAAGGRYAQGLRAQESSRTNSGNGTTAG